MKNVLRILLIALLAITVVLTAWAVIATPATSMSPMLAECGAIAASLVWGYILLVGAVLAALCCAAWGMVQNPSGIKSTLIAAGTAVVIIVASYLIAKGSPAKIPNLEDGGYFADGDALLASASIWVAYFVAAGAILTAVWSEVRGALK